MKRIGICIFLTLGSILSASADFSGMNGRWNGPGTVMNDQREVKDCGAVSIEVNRTETMLEFPDGLDNCQIISEFIDPVRFEIHEGQLFLKGKPVGEISEQKVRIKVQNTKDGFSELLELELVNGHLAYHDVISLIGESGTMTIKSLLSLKP